MPSRQDQLHSYQFAVQRVVAALVMRETDPAQSPFRRAAGATLVSLLVAAIALGGVAVYGVFVGGGAKSWRNEQAVIVEKESGARYVYRDGKLHPVDNYTSARLIVGSSQPKTVLVSRKSIEGVARGTPLGIAGAPDSLPPANRLARTPWTLCSATLTEGDRPGLNSMLLVGRAPAGGTPLADDGVLARDPGGGLHLLWRNRRHPIADDPAVLTALTWSSRRPVPVSPALLNNLEVGAGLGFPDIADRGRPSRVRPGARIGEVFVVRNQGGASQYAVALRDGLAPVTQVQVDLLFTDPRTAAALQQSKATELGQAEFASIPKEPPLGQVGPTAAPETTPKLADGEAGALCAVVRDDRGVEEIRVGATVPDVGGAVATGARSGDGAVLADYVLVEPGHGAVVEAAAAPGAPAGALSVVTDLGQRYAVAGPDVLGMLGYGKAGTSKLPAALVSLIPAGRALDPDAALTPVARD